MSGGNHNKLRMAAARRCMSMYQLLNEIMRQFDDSKFSDQHDTVVDQDTGEVSTVGKAERQVAINTALNARFRRFYGFIEKVLVNVAGDDIELPSIPTARRAFNSVSKYSDEDIAAIVIGWSKTEKAREYPSVNAAVSTASINRWVIANRKSPYFK